MLRLLANLVSHHVPTPEKHAKRSLIDLRMELVLVRIDVLVHEGTDPRLELLHFFGMNEIHGCVPGIELKWGASRSRPL